MTDWVHTAEAVMTFLQMWVFPWVMLVCGLYWGAVFGSRYGHRIGYAKGRKAERFWSNWRTPSTPDTLGETKP